MSHRTLSMRAKLILLLIAVGIIPLALVAGLAGFQGETVLMKQAFNGLETVQQNKKKAIEGYFEERLGDVTVLAGDTTIINALTDFEQAFKNDGETIGGAAWDRAVRRHGGWMKRYAEIYRYYDLFLIDTRGNILFTVAEESDLGQNVLRGMLRTSGLGKLFTRATDGIFIQDFEPYAPSGNHPASFIGAPVFKADQLLGVVVAQLPTDVIAAIIGDRKGMGRTGESYLVGKSGGITSYRTNRRIKTGKIGEIHTGPYIEKALAGESGTIIRPGSTGVMELTGYNPLKIEGLNWAILSTIDQDEVKEPVHDLLWAIVLGALIIALAVAALAFWSAREFLHPVVGLIDAADAISAGNQGARARVFRQDEIGRLAESFNNMARTTEEQYWIKSSASRFLEEMHKAHNAKQLVQKLIGDLTPFLKAGHGAFYLLNEQNTHYELFGTYGFRQRKQLNNRFAPGEGLIGQCALERQPILLTEVPPDYIRISSGLGEASPLSILVSPILYQETVRGVMEIASFHPFTEPQRLLLQELTVTLGISLENLSRVQRTEDLLQETRSQAEKLAVQTGEMAAQQEELRQINESLEQKTLSLRASEEELQSQQEELRAANEMLEERTKNLEAQKSQLEQIQRDLEMASRYKSEFMANMSHELRTPLNSLLILAKGFADNEKGNLDPDQLEAARVIHGSGMDLLTLINEILDLSKIEAGRMDVHPGPFDPRVFAESMRQSFQHVADDKKLAFHIDVASDLPATLITDGAKLERIIKNLLANAFKFTARGEVRLTIDQPAESCAGGQGSPSPVLAIRVADSGIGISRDKHQQIFEAFQQADGGTSRRFGGTGLGLSISKELAHILGGFITLESEEGRGSVFTLCLPQLPAETAITDPRPPSPRARSIPAPRPSRRPPVSPDRGIDDDRKNILPDHRTLLLIEDDGHFARIVRDLAREKGFNVLAAADGEAGLVLAREHRPTGIVLDLGLPGMDGWAVMDALKEDPETRHIPIHVISAMDGDLESLKRGAVGFFAKPVSKEQIDGAFTKIDHFAGKGIKNLLLVEDDANSRKIIANLIDYQDVIIVEADTGAQALERLASHVFDCMILDLGLPDISGFELLKRIAGDAGIEPPPVIVYSGKELTREEHIRLQAYTDSIVIKGAESEERLLDEVVLFLHRVERELPDEQRRILRKIHDSETIFQDKTVLVVDDDVRGLYALTRGLGMKGIKSLMAPSGRKALGILEERSDVHAVLMDIMMPDMDGYQTIREIRAMKRWQRLPIIAVTAKAMREDREKCLEAGANDYLTKPLDLDRLLSMLRVWLYNG